MSYGDDPQNMKVALAIAYCGEQFSGMQWQPNAITVAGFVEQALERLLGHEVVLQMGGRTDAGVHATHQVLAFETSVSRPDAAYLKGLRQFLPGGISIHAVHRVPISFHPRYQAYARRYVYLIHRGARFPVHWSRRALPYHLPLSLDLMQEASVRLLGQHDFEAFRASGCQARSSIRTIQHISWHERGPWLMMSIQADGFLYRMVRKLMRGFLSVGSRQWSLEQWHQQAFFGNKQSFPPVAPWGLYLTDILYPQDVGIAKLEPCWLERWMHGDDF